MKSKDLARLLYMSGFGLYRYGETYTEAKPFYNPKKNKRTKKGAKRK